MNYFQFYISSGKLNTVYRLKPTSSKLQDPCFSYDSLVRAFGHQLWEGLPLRELTWPRSYKHGFWRQIASSVSTGSVTYELCVGGQLT